MYCRKSLSAEDLGRAAFNCCAGKFVQEPVLITSFPAAGQRKILLSRQQNECRHQTAHTWSEYNVTLTATSIFIWTKLRSSLSEGNNERRSQSIWVGKFPWGSLTCSMKPPIQSWESLLKASAFSPCFCTPAQTDAGFPLLSWNFFPDFSRDLCPFSTPFHQFTFVNFYLVLLSPNNEQKLFPNINFPPQLRFCHELEHGWRIAGTA